MSEELPEWFVNIMLDFHNELKKGDNLEKFKKAGTATLVDKMDEELHIKGYAILDSQDPDNFMIIGKRTEIKDDEFTQFQKHTTCLPKPE